MALTFRPQLLRAVAVYHPELAFDFAVAHWDELGRMIEEPNRRASMILGLLVAASETEVLGRLDAFAAAHVSPSLEKDVRRTASLVRDNARASDGTASRGGPLGRRPGRVRGPLTLRRPASGSP